MKFLVKGECVYNVDVVRQLCLEISDATDPDKIQELTSLLQAVIREDQEEIRVRMAFLAKKYGKPFAESKAAD
jgi:hypothetical protein